MSSFPEFGLTLFLAVAAAAFFAKTAPRLRFSLTARAADALFIALALTYSLVFGTLSLLRHESFHSGGFDLGIFDQTIWNSLHGRLFLNSIAIESPITLGQHFSPLLLALVPLYAVWASPHTLLIAQTLLLAFTALPLYWFARHEIGRRMALVVTATFFLFPSLQYVNLFEFHEVAIAMPLLSLALFFSLRHKLRPFLVCLVLALLVKEEIGFVMAAFGVLMFARRQRVIGSALAVSGVVWVAAALLFVIPSFRDPIHGPNYQYIDRYRYLGNSVVEIFRNAITQPGLVLEHLIVPTKIEFILQLLVPLGFIPMLGAEIGALALPTVGYLLLGDNAFQNSIHFQYTALLIPFLFFATVIGLKRLARVPSAALGTMLLLGGILSYYFQGPGPLALQFDPNQYTITPHVQLGDELLGQIPADASVMADSNLVPHISDRQWVYQTSVVPDLRRIDYLVADTTLPIYRDYKWIWSDVLTSPFFQTLSEQDGYIFKKRAPFVATHPLRIQFGKRISLLGYTVESNLPAGPRDTISLVLVWGADRAIHERFIVFMHLVDARGSIRTQGDREPGNGWFRTDRWQKGDVTPDRYSLELPSDIPAGDYQVLVGLYKVDGGARLIATDGNDHVVLTSIQVK